MQITNMKITEITPYERNPRNNENAVEGEKYPPHKIKAKIYKGRYIATEDGMIFTMAIKGGQKFHQQKTRSNGNGYLRASIHRHDEYVHRIVAKCFLPNPNGYLEINHIDGVKTNNVVKNLEWCTRHDNNYHAFQTGLRSYKELRQMARMPKIKSRILNPNQVHEVRQLIKSGMSCSAIARLFHCSRGVIDGIHNSKTYKEGIYQC